MISTPRIRVGVVGGGLIAQLVHLRLLAEHSRRFATVALAEPSRSVREGLGRRYDIPGVFADHAEMLEGGGLDAVVVASPNGTHARVVLDCLAHGLDVLVEKPLCLDVADADRIVSAAERAGRVVQVGYMKRYDAAYEALLAGLDGAGELRHVDTITRDPVLARRFAPVDLLAADDIPAAAADAVIATTRDQVRRAVGIDDPQHVRIFSEGFLGALIHDVNLVHGVLDALGHDRTHAVDAGAAADGQALTGIVELGGGARWTMAWLLLPGLSSFDERIRFFSPDAIRTLRFPAPYARNATTTYEVERTENGTGAIRLVRSHRESYERQLLHFYECLVAGAPCRTPPEQARRDIALLTGLFGHVIARAASDR